ncbi:MAG: diguanylate cyclase [Lachnospiraceae bacterium]|nr:diguanylate cyclase [Lachnospiraceae bacterium]
MIKLWDIIMKNLNRKNNNNTFKNEDIKICTIYLMIGLFWIYFSDRMTYFLFRSDQMRLLVSTYKGFFYVFTTTAILYALIYNLLKKVNAAEMKLNETNDELSAANEELQAYIEEMQASEEELRYQYDQIVEYDKNLSASEEKYKGLIAQMQLGMALYEGIQSEDITNYKLTDANNYHEVLFGYKNSDILGKYFYQIHNNFDITNLEKLNHTLKTGEPTRYERYQTNTDKYYEIIAFRPKINQLAVIINDITKRKLAENELHFLSYHDQLTGLYNRRFFEQELIRLDQEQYYPLTITMVDINGLKLINDSFGHATGDEYIIKVAKVLSEGARTNDVACRLSGDEFIILSPNTRVEEVNKMVDKIKELAANETVNSVTVSMSFGFCSKEKIEESMIEVLKKAEDYMYKKKLFESPSMRGKTIHTIITTLHEKNPREEQHSQRVSQLCEKMGIELGMQEDEIRELKSVGLLHDIGKVAVDEGILNKNGKLTDQEMDEIRKHPEIGYRILSTVNEMSEMAEYVLAHHERWDGFGYPKGLKGEEIPKQSLIIAIADSYDAMISERSYRKALSKEYAISELKKCAGTQFNAEYVGVFVEKVINTIS